MTAERVAAYHRLHGDDYASRRSRERKYEAILSLANFAGRHVLDVGAGTGEFRKMLPRCNYTGIDLLDGENVLDHHTRYDIVVANGIFYKLDHNGEVVRLIRHMWTLTRETLIFTSLSKWAPRKDASELHLDPSESISLAQGQARI